jgi:LysM repeat protein
VATALVAGAVAGGLALVGPSEAETEHRVEAGDTVSGLAVRFGTTITDLVSANGIEDPDRIYTGADLRIPTSGGGGTSGSGGSSPVAEHRQYLDGVFDRWAEANGVRPSLLKAICYHESGWQADVVSSAGAVGVCQIMPGTADHLRSLIGVELDPNDPEDSIRMGARYLRWLLAQSGWDVEYALAGYYQGFASVRSNGPFAETDQYVRTVLAVEQHF